MRMFIFILEMTQEKMTNQFTYGFTIILLYKCMENICKTLKE